MLSFGEKKVTTAPITKFMSLSKFVGRERGDQKVVYVEGTTLEKAIDKALMIYANVKEINKISINN